MNETIRILQAVHNGDATAAEQLLPIVYEELRKLADHRVAREAPGQTLQATALVHEAYMRLVGPNAEGERGWDGRGHFFAAAAEAMRRILVERARAKGAAKRGGGRPRLQLDHDPLGSDAPSSDLIDLDEALTRLANEDADKAALVQLRFFGGMTLEEAAGVLGISPATADRHWAFARAWLYRAMQAAR